MNREGFFLLTFALSISSLLFPQLILAQSVTESWIRSAGIVCAGGLSAEVQGQLDAALLKRLNLFTGSIEGEGSLAINEATTLLDQFKKEAVKQEVLEAYFDCIKTMLETASKVPDLLPDGVVLESPDTPAHLYMVSPGGKFTFRRGETFALGSEDRLFTWHGNKSDIRARYLDVSEGIEEAVSIKQGGHYDIKGTSCALVVYDIDGENQIASAMIRCEE